MQTNQMNILIVDDDILCIEGILSEVDLKKLNFNDVLIANSYSEAVNIFQKNKVDVLLCDIEMPYASGIQLVSWIRAHEYKTECIFLTCHSEFDFARQAVTLQCFDYLLKPVEPECLISILTKVIQKIKSDEKKDYYYEYGQKYIDEFSEDKKENGMDHRQIISCLENYILEHISEELNVEQLAASVYISPNHLTRLFKKYTGKTPVEYITGQRMFLAKELLEQNHLTVSMISAKVGYGNYSYFTKSFKKIYGMTPREYRTNYLKKEK